MLTKKFLWLDIEDENLKNLPVAMIPPTKELEKTRFAEEYNEEYNKTLLDLVNVMYVAMTRPSERLYIITSKPPKTTNKINSMQAYFYHFLSSQGIWEDEKRIYSFGSRQMVDKPRPKEKGIHLNSGMSNDWKKNVILSTSAPDIWDVENPENNREWGNLVHFVLSKINSLNDVKQEVENLRNEGILDTDNMKKLSHVLEQLFLDPEINRFFQPGLNVKNEAEILLPEGSAYRPDRLILDGRNAIVLDYKTGKKEEKHKSQINKYAKILKEMGYGEVKRYLLYVDLNNDKVLEVVD